MTKEINREGIMELIQSIDSIINETANSDLCRFSINDLRDKYPESNIEIRKGRVCIINPEDPEGRGGWIVAETHDGDLFTESDLRIGGLSNLHDVENVYIRPHIEKKRIDLLERVKPDITKAFNMCLEINDVYTLQYLSDTMLKIGFIHLVYPKARY